VPADGDAGLRSIIGVLRRPRDEAQWTQVIATACQADPRFASAVARVLIDQAPLRAAASALYPVPDRLDCVAERQVYSAEGADLGRIDLLFENHDEGFALVAELKLHSEYGHEQLTRYAGALDTMASSRRGLVAITKSRPLAGEDAVAGHPGWLGSLRWSAIYDSLYQLESADPSLCAGWKATLATLRRQGDFGPMDFDAAAVLAWARRDEAEGLLRHLLNEISEPVLDSARAAVGGTTVDTGSVALILRGHTQAVVPWRNRMHLKYAIPADGEERLRVQFHARDGQPFFTVEARYEHLKEDPSRSKAVVSSTAQLKSSGLGFEVGTDWGHYWARLLPATEWLAGAETVDRLIHFADETITALAASGIFQALSDLSPTTPQSAGPIEDEQ
jgi:hypothetical protein